MGHLEITIMFTNGAIKRFKSQLQPSVKDDTMFIKNVGDNSGGSVIPLRNVRYIDIVPQAGFNMDGAAVQSAMEELEGMKK